MSKGEKKKSGKKIAIIIVAVVVAVALVTTAGIMVLKKITTGVQNLSNTVEVEPVEVRDLSDSISLTGKISGKGQASITSGANAEILSVNVSVGDIVKEGDVLCTLDKEAIEKQIAQLEKSKSNADTLAAMQNQQSADALSNAKSDKEKQISAAKKAVTQAQNAYSSAKKQLAADKSDLSDMKSKVSSAKSARDKAKTKLDAADTAYTNAKTAYKIANNSLSLMEKEEAGYEEKKAEVEKLYNAMQKASNTYDTAKDSYDTAKSNYDGIQTAIDSLSASISEGEAQLDSLSAAIDTAKDAYDTTVDTSNASVKAAEDSIKQQGLTDTEDTTADQLEELQKQLDDCEVKATMGGVITAVNVKPGDTNAAGTSIITIENTDALVVSASVAETDILKLEEGMDAIVTADAIPDREIKGKITRVVKVIGTDVSSPDGGVTSGTYSVDITIQDPDLLLGMSAKAKVIISDKANTLAVPYDLVLSDEDGNSFVLISKDNGDGTATAVKCPVTLGDEVDYYVEITGGDLKEGDMIVYDTSIVEGDTFSPQSFGEGMEPGMESEMESGAGNAVGVEVVE